MTWWILAGGALMLLYLGAKVTTGDIAVVARNAGFSGADLITAVAIAYAESSGNPNAVGDLNLVPDKGPSIGLWQINIGNKAHPEYADSDLTNPAINAQIAFQIYTDAGNSFRPWGTYDPRNATTPKYLSFLAQARKEVNG